MLEQLGAYVGEIWAVTGGALTPLAWVVIFTTIGALCIGWLYLVAQRG